MLGKKSLVVIGSIMTFALVSCTVNAFVPTVTKYGKLRSFGQVLPQFHQLRSSSTSTADGSEKQKEAVPEEPVPLLRSQGIFAVEKPLDWTSQDVVSYIRGILERDARQRGAKPVRVGSRRNKSRIIKVGHGGTLDPLATGVLVIGVGKGTKEMQGYLTGSKMYTAVGEFGFETNTLDMEGNVTKTGAFDHITMDSIDGVLPSLTGTIMQIPPIFSAIRKGGKKLYKEARAGKTADDIEIEPREVEVHLLELINRDQHQIPKFEIRMECGGGTYVRSIIRDIGYKLNTVATTCVLTRVKSGQFTLEGCIKRDDWDADKIYAAIDKINEQRAAETEEAE
mmetsp:Transcript_16076/g.25021  ORF Transcript_16076/g.25021 Transcript_16076/m.25021 type:complete len:338 (+) Transcript_16076:71-1084(+)